MQHLNRHTLVSALVEEYRANGEEATKRLFSKFIKQYEISQLGIKTIIIEFREAVGLPLK